MKISIISTVYNKEKYLSEHIDSLLNQNYKNIEFIFVNDGSTDNSLKIIKEKTTNNNKVIKRENICEKDFIKYKNYEDCFLTYKIFNRCKRFYYDIQPLYIVNRKSDNSNRITANFKFNDIKIKYIILNKLLKSEIKFKTSLKKLYLKGYLDDLQQSLKIVKSEKREYLLLLKISVPKDYFIETNLINFRYKKIYYLRYLYNNFFFNNIISFFSNQYIKFKQIVRNILIKIVRW